MPAGNTDFTNCLRRLATKSMGWKCVGLLSNPSPSVSSPYAVTGLRAANQISQFWGFERLANSWNELKSSKCEVPGQRSTVLNAICFRMQVRNNEDHVTE